MELRRTSARRAALVGVALLLVVGASACSSGPMAPAPAATVNGVEISKSEVSDLAAAYARFYAQAAGLGLDASGELAGQAADAAGTGTDTQSMSESTQALDALIRSELIEQELRRNDAMPTDADREAAQQRFVEAAGSEDTAKKIDEEFASNFKRSAALASALQNHLAAKADAGNKSLTPQEQEAEMRKIFDEEAPTRPLCLNALQAQTEDEANTARQRVEGGESFGTVAEELAPEGVTIAEGGFATCLSYEDAQSDLQVDLADAKAGDLIGPLEIAPQVQGGQSTWLLVEVDGTEGPTYEQLLPELQERVPAEPPATDPSTVDTNGALVLLYSKADISVDPMYGHWDDRTFAIVPPEVPSEPAVVATVPTETSVVAAEPGA